MKNLPVILPDMDEGVVYLGTTESFAKNKFIKVDLVGFNDLCLTLESHEVLVIKELEIKFYQDGVEMIQGVISIFFDIEILTSFLMWVEKDKEKSLGDNLEALKKRIGEYNRKHSPGDSGMM